MRQLRPKRKKHVAAPAPTLEAHLQHLPKRIKSISSSAKKGGR
jgi:hypothetical protein